MIVWLILLPVRARAKRQREVDWLSFKPDSHHGDDDGTNASIFRTPRAGVGEEEEDKTAAASRPSDLGSPESYQMHEVAHAGGLGTLYSHLDGDQWQQPPPPPTEHHLAGAGYEPTYPAYYAQQHAAPQPGYPDYSPHTSPQIGPLLFRNGSLAGNMMYGQPAPGSQHRNAPPDYGYAYGGAGPIGQVQPYAHGGQGMPPQPMQHSQSARSVTARSAASEHPNTSPSMPQSRSASGSVTAVSHGCASGSNGAGKEERRGKQVEQAMPVDKLSTANNLQRRDSKKALDHSEDVRLPYDRESQSPTVDVPASHSHLHLVNPDH